MKLYLVTAIVITMSLLGFNASAQSKIKDGTISGGSNAANANAILELESNNKGLLLPRIALTALNAASPLTAHVAGITVYNTATAGSGSNAVTPGYYYNDGTKWVKLMDAATADTSKDAWVDDNANTMVKLGTQSDGITARSAGSDFVIKDNGATGIGTSTPQKQLHVAGALQVTNELNVGGNATTAGSAGTTGQVLTSNGTNAAPQWKTPSQVISATYYVQGTTEATINAGNTADVPGTTLTHIVPAGATQTLLFTVTGYIVRNDLANNNSAQGVFMLTQDGTKISSAFTSVTYNAQLGNLPLPATLLKAITLTNSTASPVTYTFKVRYAAWAGAVKVNFNPSTYLGYNGDTEAMLTKMQVLVYNN